MVQVQGFEILDILKSSSQNPGLQNHGGESDVIFVLFFVFSLFVCGKYFWNRVPPQLPRDASCEPLLLVGCGRAVSLLLASCDADF